MTLFVLNLFTVSFFCILNCFSTILHQIKKKNHQQKSLLTAKVVHPFSAPSFLSHQQLFRRIIMDIFTNKFIDMYCTTATQKKNNIPLEIIKLILKYSLILSEKDFFIAKTALLHVPWYHNTTIKFRNIAHPIGKILVKCASTTNEINVSLFGNIYDTYNKLHHQMVMVFQYKDVPALDVIHFIRVNMQVDLFNSNRKKITCDYTSHNIFPKQNWWICKYNLFHYVKSGGCFVSIRLNGFEKMKIGNDGHQIVIKSNHA